MKPIPLSPSEKNFLDQIRTYFNNSIGEVPWEKDYIILRFTQKASNDYSDIIYIPTLKPDPNEYYYQTFKCNSFKHDKTKLITGSFTYRLASRFNCIYAQQICPVFYENTISQSIHSDHYQPKLNGLNLLFHPIHSILPILSPISQSSKGSIIIDPKAYPLIKQHYLNGHPEIKLFVIDMHLLLWFCVLFNFLKYKPGKSADKS